MAILMPLSISVPPPPVSPSVKRRALLMLSPVAGMGLAKSLLALPAKVMTWRVSAFLQSLRNFCMASMTLAVGLPLIDPETSMRKTISLGGLLARRSSSAGWIMSMK